jgi:alkylation response protein AidB-like acyl-CoA dehydrogenase
MHFAFTRDQLLFRDSLRDVLKRECTPALVRASWGDRNAADELWKTFAELGVVGLTAAEEHGGLGLDALDGVLLFEECGRYAAPVPLLETMAVAVPLLRDEGSAALKAKWLGPIARGEARVAVGLDPRGYVRDADVAQILLIADGEGVTAVEAAGVHVEAHPSVDHARRIFRVTISDTAPRERFAPSTALAAASDRAALAASAELVGLAARMVELTVEYAKVRKQFGAPIGSFQAVKHHLATAHMKVELARPAVYRAAYSVAHADPDAATHVSIGKACASDAATLAARAALQCHGAIGYSFEHDLHLWMKRAWALAATHGDAAWHRARVATAILGDARTARTGDRP